MEFFVTRRLEILPNCNLVRKQRNYRERKKIDRRLTLSLLLLVKEEDFALRGTFLQEVGYLSSLIEINFGTQLYKTTKTNGIIFSRKLIFVLALTTLSKLLTTEEKEIAGALTNTLLWVS
jgi:hypothetical protein